MPKARRAGWRQAASGYLHAVSDALSPRPWRRANRAARPLPVGVPYPRGVPLASPPAEKEGVGGLCGQPLHLGPPGGPLVTDLSTLTGNAFSFRALGFRGVPLPCEKGAFLRPRAPGQPASRRSGCLVLINNRFVWFRLFYYNG